ncbi:hypothetical protein CFC21_075096 [Triticum aestivum]|uniref:FCP1 homology domain-containing protein n=2 Tax=Triticum aestivum TaxID=4565 RepID=A0A3B6LYE6_WHEAT|nr:hypothetical protein CFC21_075096 [Triticum aestivum]
MPTRKKGPARNATVEHVNTKTSRQPGRSTQSAAPDKKVNDLITSSSKKQKPAEDPLKKNQVLSGGRKLTSLCDSDTENGVADVPSSSMLDHKLSHGNDDEPCENIFSQPFHHHNEDGSDGLSKDGGCADPDETEELDEFDPYTFIKDLPELSMVVPKFRPVLLPKQTRSCPRTTLVLDLDETLVHSTLEPCEDSDFTFPVHFNLRDHTIYVRCRPYLKDFLERVASMFEIIIFTASQSIYAEQLLNVLDPKRRLFRHRVYRESCVYVEGNYLKDLSVLGRDLSRVVIVDNSPQAFGFQLDNGIPIESWFDDPNDKELLALLPFLESLVEVEDVRPFIATKFNLRQKVASATSLAMHFFPNAERAN